MTDTSATAPTDPTSRIHSLDVLRGIAILGILIINIQLFSDPAALFLNPTLSDSFTGLNYVTWVFTHVFAQQNFLTIFSVLFGASIALFMEKKSGSQHSAIVLHYRRMFWLFVIGVMHTYLLWNGDILASYAVSAAIVVWARHWTPINQLLAGIGVATVGSIHELSFAVEGKNGLGGWTLSDAALQADITAHQVGWVELFMYRSGEILPSKVIGFIAWGFWRTAGLMLVGMALYNSGFLTLSYSRRLYKRVVLFTVPVGIALTSAGVVYIEMNAWAAESALYWRAFNYWGSMLLGTGYITLIIPYCSSEARTRVQRVLASVGRTALSNYILQSLIATWIFYGYGLGLYGSVNRVEQLGIVLVIWAVQIVVSVLWLRRFQYGPLEWVWRTLTYQSRQPLSK